MRSSSWIEGVALVAALSLGSCRTPHTAPPPPTPVQSAPLVDDALAWLLAHRASDGHWDSDDFAQRCRERGAIPCDGAGSPELDIATTASAVLAILGCETKKDDPRFRTAVESAVRWLVFRQSAATGCVGETGRESSARNHALATLAMAETYRRAKPFLLRAPAQRALDFATRSRNAQGVWSRELPASSDDDVTVTSWMLLALVTGRDAGLRVDESVIAQALTRCRTLAMSDNARNADARSSTRDSRWNALALLAARWLPELVQAPERDDQQHLSAPLQWDERAQRSDFEAWYFTTLALRTAGDERAWRRWSAALRATLVDSRCNDGECAGSWPPLDPLLRTSGRIYTPALLTLCVEACDEPPQLRAGD